MNETTNTQEATVETTQEQGGLTISPKWVKAGKIVGGIALVGGALAIGLKVGEKKGIKSVDPVIYTPEVAKLPQNDVEVIEF